MPAYDPSIIEQYAERLYKKASSIVVSYTISGALLGFLPFAVLSVFDQRALILAFCLGISFGLVGWELGREKAFQLRLQAQTALCQAQIEANTRPTKAEKARSHDREAAG